LLPPLPVLGLRGSVVEKYTNGFCQAKYKQEAFKRVEFHAGNHALLFHSRKNLPFPGHEIKIGQVALFLHFCRDQNH
jgi:hypothetical protein